MRIISRFKDYYDHVAHVYGGGDPKIVYARKNLREPEGVIPGFGGYFPDLRFLARTELHVPYIFGLRSERYWHPADSKWASCYGSYLCVAGKVFLLIANGSADPVFYKSLDGAEDYVKNVRAVQHMFDQFDGTKVFPEMVELCRKVDAPVFRFTVHHAPRDASDGQRLVSIKSEVPVLSTMGLAKFYPAETIYQDLSYFMGNTIHGSPDLDPPTKVSDKDRLVQRGFDVKTSFRGKA